MKENDTKQNFTTKNSDQTSKFRPKPVTVTTVILTIKHLRETNAIGADGIAFRFVKDSLPVICFYLMIIINTSIVTGLFPLLWKHGLINPTFKSGDIDEVSNFRPISLLSILSKVLEKIVTNQLMEYLESNRLLSNSQHGFRINLSTETALMQVTDKIYNNIDENKITLLTLCDLSKAFDSVNHKILLKKLIDHHIDTFWFEDYLSYRTQSVRIGKTISSKLNVPFGVPQGSILGPILFLIFVNDMKNVTTNCLLVQYADDSQFIHTGTTNNLQELIRSAENTMKEAKHYFDSNGLMINTKKTQCIFIGSRQNISKIPEETKINCSGDEIIPSKFVKNLGVHMDRYMLFDKHIDEMHKKTMGTLIYLNRIKDRIERDVRIKVVQALALSLINYCSKIWGTTSKTQIQRVQKLQNFAAKIAIGNVRKYDHVTPHIKELKWLKIEQKCLYDTCIFVYKILRKQIPSWLLKLTTVRNVNPVMTRQQNDLFIPRTRTYTGARDTAVRGPMLWNNLPNLVKDGCSLGVFKNKLKEHYLSSQ